MTVATIASPFSRPSRFSCVRAHQQHGVAVHDLAAVIDEDGAIAVAVERDAHPQALLDDGPGELARDGWIRSAG